MKHRHAYYTYVPILGITCFLLLFVVATYLYPGGNQMDSTCETYSWVHNYWCDLLGEKAGNGQVNEARFFAIPAMLILCISLSFFWYFLPLLFRQSLADKNQQWKAKTIRFCGISAMFVSCLLFTSLHNMVINITALLGGIALVITFSELKKQQYPALFYLALFCLTLCSINFAIYQSSTYLLVLPLLQKITFLICFGWIIAATNATRKIMMQG